MEAPKPAPEVVKPQTGDVVEAIEFRGSPARSAGYPARPDLHQEGRHLSTKKCCTAISWRCGTPAASTISGSKPNRAPPASSFASCSPSAASFAPSNTKATSRSPSRKFSTASKNAKSAFRSNRSTIRTRCSARAVVLKEYLAERGRQFATVTPEIQQIPPSSLEVIFNVDEGPKVKVGKIDIEGNKVFSDREVIRAMKNLQPIGIPHSIFFENLFAKTYDSSKLEEDKERIREAYQDKGYFTAQGARPHGQTARHRRRTASSIPLFKPNKPGKAPTSPSRRRRPAVST